MLKTAADAPMPRATVRIESAVNAGDFDRERAARRTSRKMSLMA
jgi:hypothetical protein